MVLTYAEQEVFCSRSRTGGVVEEDIEGVVGVVFTHWDSRAGDFMPVPPDARCARTRGGFDPFSPHAPRAVRYLERSGIITGG